MATDLTTYEGRARKRPPGASDLTQRIYRLLAEHPEGLTRDEIHEDLREGWMDTDAYRAYWRALEAQRTKTSERKRRLRSHASEAKGSGGNLRLEYGTPEFKAAAQRRAIVLVMRAMRRGRTIRSIDTQSPARYFIGERAPLVPGSRPRVKKLLMAVPTLVPFDPVKSREILNTTTTEHIRREKVKAQLLDGLKDGRIKGRSRELIQLALDHISGR